MTFETITLAHDGPIATLTLNMPAKLNAIAPKTDAEIVAALAALHGARVLVLKGAGKAFCAGADLTSFGGAPQGLGAAAEAVLRDHHNPMIAALMALPIPVIAAVRGAAAGIGCSIALTADFVIASQSAYFLQAFVNIGLVPDGGASWMLPRLVGLARAKEMMLLGERVSAQKALDWGMIYQCVADDALDAEVAALAARLAGGPTVALGTARGIINAALAQDLGSALNAEATGQRIAGDSADATEGAMAFLQKRAPQFQGC